MSLTIRSLASRLRQRLTKITQKSPCQPVPRHRVRLGLEQFEAREVPARLFWVGAAGTDATNPANWYYPKDDVTGVLPGANDVVIFGYYADNVQYPSAASTPCIGLAGTFSDVQITDTYSSTVTFGGAVTIGALKLAGGAISQPTSGTDLTVTSSFTWTGGILNSATTESTLFLSGATASINASAGTTLHTGNALVLQGGTSMTVEAPAIDFRFGSSVIIDASTMLIGANAPKAVEWSGPAGSYDDGKARIELKNGGGLTIRQFDFNAKNRTFLNNGGNLILESGATATFGSSAAPPAGTPVKVDILQNSGSITIGGSCTLTSPYGSMKVSSGSLFVDADSTAPTGTIGCQLTFAGGTIRILDNFGTLRVKKDIYWLGGTFQCTIDAANDKSDKIITDKKFYVGGNATLQIFILGYNPQTGLGNTFSRRVLSATDGFASVVANEEISITIINPQNGPQFNLVPSTLVGGGEVYDLVSAS